MKKVYNLVLVCGLSLLTIGASAQSLKKAILTKETKHIVTAHLKHAAHKPTAGTTYAFIDYPVIDSAISSQYAGISYLGSPLAQGFYVQDLNTHYVNADSGTQINPVLLHSASVAFDSIIDISGTAYQGQSVVVDSLFIPVGQENLSGKNDTLVVQINSVTAAGIPTSTVLWSQTIIQDTGLSSGPSNAKGAASWFYAYTLQLAPQFSLPAGSSKFAVTLKYYDETKQDTFGFLYGSPAYNCAAAGGNFPDTTYVGTVIKITGTGGGLYTANSFTNGYAHYTNGTTTITLPSAAYGAGLSYACGTASSTGLDWQDIAMYAEVSFTDVTGVNAVKDNGLTIGQNYPNPFNKTTNISYSLTKSSDVVFTVSDMTGRTLINNTYSNSTPGQHVISLSASEFTPGVYFYTFNVNGSSVTKKMIITE
jgi:hypothetical protein